MLIDSVFDLPEELLATLTLKNHTDQHVPESPSPKQSAEEPDKLETDGSGPAKATSCNLCGLSFPSVAEQRSHVRSDLHGYNLKQKIKGVEPVGEADFEKLIGDLDESISGSESEESDEDDEHGNGDGGKPKDSTLSALLKKQARLQDPEFDEFAAKKRHHGPGKPPLLWFASSSLPENLSLGIYRAIFSHEEQEEESHILDTIRKKQLPPMLPPKLKNDGGVSLPGTNFGPHYFLCMIGGGHFAAMVVALAPKMGKKLTGVDERSATVIAHKGFHRYTTRRKQGGSQSANDNAKGNAHSAGSSIRRYNEVALANEVRELLSSWKTMIDTADLIFVRATGSTNRRTLFGPYEGQVLRSNDPRNRGFPFSTRRATQKELMRAFVELTRVKQSVIDEAALAALNNPPADSTPKAPAAVKPKPPKPSKEEEEASLHTSQIIPLIKRSKVPALLNYLKTNNVPATFTFLPENHHTPTSLHLAASLNSAPVVNALLTKGGADPTIMNDDARTPFTLAGDRATRDAFRVARHELGESAWDWEKAGVPAALSKSEADKRETEEKSEKAAETQAESERRKAETERVRKEGEAEEAKKRDQRLGKGKALGALPVKTGADLREEEARGLTPEARARIERERRARAAEARFKKT